MSIQHEKLSDAINLLPGHSNSTPKTMTLLKSDDLEVIRLIVPAGAAVRSQELQGELTVQCLQGRVIFTTASTRQELDEGQMLYLAEAAPHSVHAVEDSSVLLTIHTGPKTVSEPFDIVDEASDESFPASDPPSRQPIIRP